MGVETEPGVEISICRGCRASHIAEDPPVPASVSGMAGAAFFCTDRCRKSYLAGRSDAVDECVTVLIQVAHNARARSTAMVLASDRGVVPRPKMFDAVARIANRVADSIRRGRDDVGRV